MSAEATEGRGGGSSRLTIGTVCKSLQEEFPDISISKIRFLEDQRLITPRRTPGGYRLYGEEDVDQLRAILRMQRDEFLPLRVIRQVIAQGRSAAGTGPPPAARGGRRGSAHVRPAARGRRRRPGVRARAGGVPADRAARERVRLAVQPGRRRDRDHLPAAGPLRGRRSPPEGVPVGGRARGGP